METQSACHSRVWIEFINPEGAKCRISNSSIVQCGLLIARGKCPEWRYDGKDFVRMSSKKIYKYFDQAINCE